MDPHLYGGRGEMEMLEVRPSTIHGKGLFARTVIPAERLLGELTGTLISIRQARRRARKRSCIAIVEFDDGTALDASRDGNCFVHINHSCTPNACMRRRSHHVEFYTLRPVNEGEELTCDYGETHHFGTLPCRCGSEQCRRHI